MTSFNPASYETPPDVRCRPFRCTQCHRFVHEISVRSNLDSVCMWCANPNEKWQKITVQDNLPYLPKKMYRI